MQKYLLSIFAFALSNSIEAQNVGIGTTIPTTKLEIKNPLKSTVKISTNTLEDTTQLIFSNKSFSFGTEMLITSIKETGLRFSSTSDLAENIKDTIMQITPTGNVGIRTATPQFPLDVKGDMNVTGELKAKGLSGLAGDVLQSNGNGTMSWQSPGSNYGFKNRKIIYRQGATPVTFNLPISTKDLMVEIWGSGAGGNQMIGGCSGAYGSIYKKNIDWGNQSIIFTLEAGGFGQIGALLPTSGGVSRVDFGGSPGVFNMIVQGGQVGTGILSGFNIGVPGTTLFSSSNMSNANFINGNFGEATYSIFGQKSATIFTEQKFFGTGASPVGLDIKKSSINPYQYFENGVSVFQTSFPSASNYYPGSGGGAFGANSGYNGGPAFAIVWWND